MRPRSRSSTAGSWWETACGKALLTSRGDYCFHGVTRANVIALAHTHDLPIEQCDFRPEDVYAADEAFVTGTFGGITAVRALDARPFKQPLPGPITQRVHSLYEQLKDRYAGATT